MPRTCIFAFSLSIGIAFSAAAMATDMPKEGTFSGALPVTGSANFVENVHYPDFGSIAKQPLTSKEPAPSTQPPIARSAQASPASAGPASSSAKKSYAPASIHAQPGLQCKLYPEGSAPSTGILVFTDDDGYARFHAVKSNAHDATNRLTLDCTDATGKLSNYSVDLTSDTTFIPNPIDLANMRGTDRPALRGDPLSYSQSQLLEAGYGLRPDPVKLPGGYARWLAAASKRGRLLQTQNAILPQRTSFLPQPPQKGGRVESPLGLPQNLVPQQASNWYGAVLTGAPDYVFTQATFYVPQAIPGGDNTGKTGIYLWNGLGGFDTEGGGLIQGIVSIQTTTTIATYSTFREYCCGDCQYTLGPGTNCSPSPPATGNQGFFSPNPGDFIFDQAWYCDATGNPNINGGYGCVFMQNQTSGAIVSCTSYLGSPCSSVKAFPLCSVSPKPSPCMTLGKSAEFIIENPAGALTDFVHTIVPGQSEGVKMEGWAITSSGTSYSSGDDPAVNLFADTSASSHAGPYMAVGINPEVAATCFTISAYFDGPLAYCGGVYIPPPRPGGGGCCYINGIPVHCPGCNPAITVVAVVAGE